MKGFFSSLAFSFSRGALTSAGNANLFAAISTLGSTFVVTTSKARTVPPGPWRRPGPVGIDLEIENGAGSWVESVSLPGGGARRCQGSAQLPRASRTARMMRIGVATRWDAFNSALFPVGSFVRRFRRLQRASSSHACPARQEVD